MKKSGLLLLKVVFSVGILVYIFTRVVHISDLWANLREVSVSYLVAAVAVYLLVQSLSAYRWYLILKPLGIETGFPKILALYYLGMYFNFFLPSAIGGDVFKVYYLHKETGRLSASTATVFLDRDVGMGVQFGCAFVNILAASAIGFHTQHGWIDYMVFIPAIGLIGMIPLSVNGAGWREASYILLFQSVAVGVDANQAKHQAATLSLLWLGIVIITSLPGGIIYLLR